MKGNSIITLFLCLCSFVIGFVLSKYTQVPHLSLETKIDGVSVISLILPIVIAYFIFKHFDKVKEDRSREKELILKRVEEIYQFINEQSFLIGSSNIKYTQAAANFKRINLQMINIEKLLQEVHLKLEIDYTSTIISSAQNLKKLQTDSPSKKLSTVTSQEIDIPIKIENGLIYYSDSRTNEITKEFDNLKNHILKHQLQINKS